MIISFQLLCYVQGRQPADQAAQSHIQPGLECLQGWGIHSLLGQPVLVCHHPLGEKLPPHILPKPPLSPSCPIDVGVGRAPSPAPGWVLPSSGCPGSMHTIGHHQGWGTCSSGQCQSLTTLFRHSHTYWCS